MQPRSSNQAVEYSLKMAELGIKLLVVCAVAAFVVALANGDAAATATPSTICNITVSGLVQCLPAITGKSPPHPTTNCCTVIKEADLRCLCNYKSQFTNFGIDPNNAMALPKKCGRKLPRECKKKL